MIDKALVVSGLMIGWPLQMGHIFTFYLLFVKNTETGCFFFILYPLGSCVSTGRLPVTSSLTRSYLEFTDNSTVTSKLTVTKWRFDMFNLILKSLKTLFHHTFELNTRSVDEPVQELEIVNRNRFFMVNKSDKWLQKLK